MKSRFLLLYLLLCTNVLFAQTYYVTNSSAGTISGTFGAIMPQAIASANAGHSVKIFFMVPADACGNSLCYVTTQLPVFSNASGSILMQPDPSASTPQGIVFSTNMTYNDVFRAKGGAFRIKNLRIRKGNVEGSSLGLNFPCNPVFSSVSMASYDPDTELGKISIDLSSITNKLGPYHYFVSDKPIPNLQEQYTSLTSTVFGGSNPADQPTFFKGIYPSPIYVFDNLYIGKYYVKVFDSNGVLLHENQLTIQPVLNLVDNSGLILERNNTLVGNVATGNTAIDFYMSDFTEREIVFYTNSAQTTQYLGLKLRSNSSSVNNVDFGFKISNSTLYIITNGAVQTTTVPTSPGARLKLAQQNGKLNYYQDNFLIYSQPLPTNYLLMPMVLVIRGVNDFPFYCSFDIYEKKKSNYYKSIPAGCTGSDGQILVNTIPLFGRPYFNIPSNSNVTVSLLNSSGSVIPQDATFNMPYNYSFSNLSAGTYSLTVVVNGTIYKQNIEVPVRALWKDVRNVDYTAFNSLLNLKESVVGNMQTASYSASSRGKALTENQVSSQLTYVDFNVKNMDNSFTSVGFSNVDGTYSPVFQFFNTSVSPSVYNVSNVPNSNNEYSQIIGTFGAIYDYRIEYDKVLGTMKLYRKSNSFLGSYFSLIGLAKSNVGADKQLIMMTTSSMYAGIYNVTTNANCVIPVVHAQLKRELDAGYVQTMANELRFYFEEEYKQPANAFLPLKIYDMDYIVKASVSYNGALYGSAQLSTKLSYNYDDNRYSLPLGNLNLVKNKFYVLEVETSTKEKRFLRFYYR